MNTTDEILVVDDAPAILRLLEGILVGAGYRVRLATDGELALRSAKIQPPALVLLDIRMPDMDGYEVCQRLKEDERTRSVPTIFLSILENEHEKVKAFQVGGVDYITKPIRSAEVLARVHTHLSLRHARMDLEARNVELEAARETLEERVTERSVELEAFAYSVSHDLRAPLRHIAGFLELLEKRIASGLDVQGRHYMTAVMDSANRMGVLVDELLSFSRMGRQEMRKTPVDLGPLVQEVIREQEPDTQGRDIHWHVGDLPIVIGDRAMLKIVLVNLLSNAMKFTRTRPNAEIEVECLAGLEAETIIAVRDNGVGFDMTYVDKLFCVFQRLHRADEFEGTGIGTANDGGIL